jgi:multiple sugar transport system permease protein
MISLTRWGAGALLAAGVSAFATLAAARWAATRSEGEYARRSAATTAAYLALVTPGARRGAGYSLPQLFIQTRSLDAIPGWTPRVEVYYGTAPLLQQNAPPLAPPALDRLRGQAEPRWRGGVALAPLFDRDRWDVVGAVAIRPADIAPGWLGGWTFPALVLLVAAAVVALRIPGVQRARVRRALAAYGAAAALFAAAAYANVYQAARRSTDRWLQDTRLLMQEATARLPRGRPTLADLTPLAVGAGVAPGDSATTRPTRRRVDGVPQALVEVRLSSRRWVELSTAAAEGDAVRWLPLLLALAFVGPLAAWVAAWAERQAAHPEHLRQTVAAWGFLAPTALHLAVFSLAPMLFAVYVSLHRWSVSEPVKPFVGLANFAQLARDPLVWISLRNTALYALTVPATMVLALLVALALNRRTWTARLARTAFLLPYAASVVAVALVWQWMYHPDFGVVNWALSLVGIGPVDWLGSPKTALVALMIVSVWVQLGYQLTLFLAGLQAIPRAYLDAALVDGASAWRRFWTITLPLLKPVTAFVFVTGVISSFQVFTYVYVLTAGGPRGATDVVAYRLYQIAWVFLQFGSASALSLLLFLVLFGATWAQFRLLERRVAYG